MLIPISLKEAAGVERVEQVSYFSKAQSEWSLRFLLTCTEHGENVQGNFTGKCLSDGPGEYMDRYRPQTQKRMNRLECVRVNIKGPTGFYRIS